MVTSIRVTGKMEHLMDKVSFLIKRINKFMKVYGKKANLKVNVKVLKQNSLLILSTRKRELLFLSIH
jgi:hypothetical protein